MVNMDIAMDCGASSSVTGSLINTKDTGSLINRDTKDVIEKITKLEPADGVDSMKATHQCMKTYFVRNRMGEVQPITVHTLHVRGLPQDILG